MNDQQKPSVATFRAARIEQNFVQRVTFAAPAALCPVADSDVIWEIAKCAMERAHGHRHVTCWERVT